MDAHDRSTPLMHKFRHPLWLVWLVLAVAGGYYLLTRHEQHVAQLVPYLLLLACPLMHVFMHRGHGGHHHHGGTARSDSDVPRDG